MSLISTNNYNYKIIEAKTQTFCHLLSLLQETKFPAYVLISKATEGRCKPWRSLLSGQELSCDEERKKSLRKKKKKATVSMPSHI